MLEVEIESFSYSEKPILKEIAFTLKPGEHLSVLGESGCGKSTLLHLVYGLLHLENGSVHFNQKKTARSYKNPHSWRTVYETCCTGIQHYAFYNCC